MGTSDRGKYAIPRLKNGIFEKIVATFPAGITFAIWFGVIVVLTVMSGLQVTQKIMERGWFPRTVPSADGRRAARSPGA